MVARGRYKRSLPPQLFVNDRCPWVGGLEEPAPREPVALQPQSQAKWPIDWPGQQVCQALGFVAPPPALPPAVPGGVSPDKKQTCLAALLFDVAVGCAVHYSQWAGRAALLICHSDDPPPPPRNCLAAALPQSLLFGTFFLGGHAGLKCLAALPAPCAWPGGDQVSDPKTTTSSSSSSCLCGWEANIPQGPFSACAPESLTGKGVIIAKQLYPWCSC